jgi:putative SOS response-associated peptidase YedK
MFRAAGVPELLPARYIVAPTQQVAAVRKGESGREFAWLRWGLIPPWAKDKKLAPINAMAETAATKPMFRSAFKKRRCLVPADGYYEWKATGGETKQPYLFTPADGKPFAFAGLWEAAELDGEQIESCAILTTDANELAAQVHKRMPVILPAEAYEAWLDPANQDTAAVQSLLLPYPADRMRSFPVSTWVNNLRHDDPRCVEPAA